MTALNFPNSPALGEIYSKYIWDGEKWMPGHTNVVIPPSTLFIARTSGLDATHINAYTALIDGLVTDGVWSQLDILYIFATTSTTNALLNLVSTSYNGTVSGSLTFVAGRGYSPAAGFIDTGFNPTTAVSPKYTQNAAHISVWLTNDNSGPGAGAAQAGGGNVPWQMIMPGPTMYARINVNGSAVGGGQNFTNSAGLGYGHFIAVRNNSTDVRGFYSGAAIAAAIGGQTSTILNLNMYAMGVNNNGSGGAASQNQLAVSFGGALDTSQTLALYTRIKTYMLAVGAPTEEVSQFFARTGIIGSAPLEAAYIALITGLVRDGIWAKLDVLYVFAAQDTTRALLNLKSSSFPATPNGSPTFTQYRGYTGVDSSNTVYIDTGFNPTTASSPKYTQNDAHLSVWMVSDVSQAQPVIGNGTGVNISAIIPKLSGANAYFPVNAAWFSVANTNGQGHFVAVRPDASTGAGYRNGSSILSGASAVGIRANYNMNVLGFRLDGTPYGGAGQVAAASIGGALTATEVANFYTHLRTFLTLVGVP